MRAPRFAELLQVPLTSFDNEYQLTALGAESWTQSEDGLTWTFKLRDGLVWSDGEPLTAEDYVFALQHAATSAATTSPGTGILPAASRTGRKSPKARPTPRPSASRRSTTRPSRSPRTAPKPYMPSVVSLWYPVPKHQFDKFGDDWSTNVENVVSSGPFKLEELGEVEQLRRPGQEPETYTGPWPAEVDELTSTRRSALPEVGMPAFLAGDAAYTYLNAGQIPVVKAADARTRSAPTRCSRPPTSRSTSRPRRSTTSTCAAPSTTRSTATS